MTLKDFREQTKHLPDDCEIDVNVWTGNEYGEMRANNPTIIIDGDYGIRLGDNR